MYLITDFISTSVAVLLFNIIRYHLLTVSHHGFTSLHSFITSPMVISGQIILPTAMMLVYTLSGYYNHIYNRSRIGELTNTMGCALIGTIGLLLTILINDLTSDRAQDYSMLLLLFALLFTVVYVPRCIISRILRRKIRRGIISFPTVVVGYSSHPELFGSQLRNIDPESGIKAVMLCDADNRSRSVEKLMPLPIGDIDGISAMCAGHHAERIILIPHPESWEKTLSVINRLLSLDLNIFIAAESLPPYLFNTRLPNIVAEPLIDVSRVHLSARTLNLKRAFDITGATLLLSLSALPMLFMAIAIKTRSKGPVFFKQQRIGLHRKPFTIYKLRTMVVNAESDNRPALSHKGDDRITPMGRVLRKYHLDELPQFYNVLRGDMSLVGPRPERLYYIEQIVAREPSYTLVHRVRPGITSLGMVKFGYASTVDEMIQRMRYDLLYLENMSIGTDLKILFYTVHNVISGKGV